MQHPCSMAQVDRGPRARRGLLPNRGMTSPAAGSAAARRRIELRMRGARVDRAARAVQDRVGLGVVVRAAVSHVVPARRLGEVLDARIAPGSRTTGRHHPFRNRGGTRGVVPPPGPLSPREPRRTPRRSSSTSSSPPWRSYCPGCRRLIEHISGVLVLEAAVPALKTTSCVREPGSHSAPSRTPSTPRRRGTPGGTARLPSGRRRRRRSSRRRWTRS